MPCVLSLSRDTALILLLKLKYKSISLEYSKYHSSFHVSEYDRIGL